jgi:hypothetical protein
VESPNPIPIIVKGTEISLMRRLGASILVAAIACGLPLFAQSWESLSALHPGDRVVVDAGGGKVKGEFRAVTPEAIRVATGRNETAVQRARVRRVQVRSTSRRVRRVAIAAAIGVAVGVTADQTLGTYLRNETGESTGARVATYTAPIGLFAAIAAAVPGYRTVYRAR